MNAPLRHSEIRIDPLAVFVARAEARALLWKCCEFDLYEAVDILQYAAERAGSAGLRCAPALLFGEQVG